MGWRWVRLGDDTGSHIVASNPGGCVLGKLPGDIDRMGGRTDSLLAVSTLLRSPMGWRWVRLGDDTGSHIVASNPGGCVLGKLPGDIDRMGGRTDWLLAVSNLLRCHSVILLVMMPYLSLEPRGSPTCQACPCFVCPAASSRRGASDLRANRYSVEGEGQL